MTKEEALEFIAQSVKSDVDMAKVADAIKAIEQDPNIRHCFGCKYAKDNHNSGTEECHLCMWENQYTPITDNDLEVDCISRERALEPYKILENTDTLSVYTIRRNLAELPSVTPQEPKIGHWIDTDEWSEIVDGFEQWGYFRKCSKCGYVFKFLEIDNYCPNCGAKMKSEVEDDTD